MSAKYYLALYHFTLSFHNKLKTNPRYLAHTINRRIDDLVGLLLTIEEDLFHDRMRKEVCTVIVVFLNLSDSLFQVMRDSDEASLKCEGIKRHHEGISIPDTAVKV